jgi:hypothetical protein
MKTLLITLALAVTSTILLAVLVRWSCLAIVALHNIVVYYKGGF